MLLPSSVPDSDGPCRRLGEYVASAPSAPVQSQIVSPGRQGSAPPLRALDPLRRRPHDRTHEDAAPLWSSPQTASELRCYFKSRVARLAAAPQPQGHQGGIAKRRPLSPSSCRVVIISELLRVMLSVPSGLGRSLSSNDRTG